MSSICDCNAKMIIGVEDLESTIMQHISMQNVCEIEKEKEKQRDREKEREIMKLV